MKKSNRRRQKLWKLPYNIAVINYSFCALIILNVIIFYTFITIVNFMADTFSALFRFTLLLSSFIAVDFIFIGLVLIIVNRSIGALPRMNKILDKFLQGDRKVRFQAREKDFIKPIGEKINKIMDMAGTGEEA